MVALHSTARLADVPVSCVCDLDPYCCDTQWDDICVTSCGLRIRGDRRCGSQTDVLLNGLVWRITCELCL